MNQDLADIIELHNALATGRAVAPETAEQLALGLRRYLAGDAPTLDHALGLTVEPGQRRHGTQLKTRARDAALWRAAQLLEGDTPWALAALLLDEVRVFERSFWCAWSRLDEAPPESSGLRRALFDAFRTGLEIPRSVTGLVFAIKRGSKMSSPYTV